MALVGSSLGALVLPQVLSLAMDARHAFQFVE